MSRSPPLAALRAFEAAARHRSFTKAGEELFLTQSAISRHVRNIEDYFGVPMFFRSHRAITLTPEGDQYMRELVDAFARIDLATRRVKHAGRQDILTVHVYTTFAMQWLIPRLKRFQDTNPEVDVRMTASLQPVDFNHDNIHCAIRTSPNDWGKSVRADKLFDSWLIPVGAPATVAGLREPRDLRNATLLHSLARIGDWRLWLNAAGAADIDADRGLKFESSAMAYLAAAKGMGIAMAQGFLVQDELRRGSLLKVFPQTVQSDRTYYLLSSPRYLGHPALEVFRDWLLAELPNSSTTT